MRFKILPHTADLRLKVFGKNLEELFQNAVLGLSEVICDGAEKLIKRARGFKKIAVKVPDSETLLASFLNDVLTASHTDKKIYPKAKILKISPHFIEAQIFGIPVSKFQKDVKAVSYHDIKITRNKKDVLEVILVFDV